MQIIALPAFDDNYIWSLSHGGFVAVVDPGDEKPVLQYLKDTKQDLVEIFITHHHADHVGGVERLTEAYPHAKVYGPFAENVSCIEVGLAGGDQLTCLGTFPVIVMDVPGHTHGHIAYDIQVQDQHHLFCGDVLFSAGCGRVFEGTPATMFSSLQQIARLDPKTLIYSAHEYTLSNIKFARVYEPSNRALLKWEQDALALRMANQPTLPTSLQHELEVNPFLRTYSEEIRLNLNALNQLLVTDDLSTFTALRACKNTFR